MGKALRLSVIGLGKLGASMAAAMASRGREVVAVDVLQRTVDAVNAGRAPVQETNLEETIRACRGRLRATTSHRDAVLESDASFVVVPTPSDEKGAFSLQYAAWAFRELGRALRDKPGYHLIVLSSTVLPGATRHGLLPILERESGKKAGADFGFCYSPEFIALGSIIENFLNPDFTLVGEFDSRSGDMLEQIYADVLQNQAPCQRMSLENAELTKVAVNSYITMKITFANMITDLCERVPGGDVDVVSAALGQDKRIGRRYLTGGVGYGGPCFPRDNVALAYLARVVGAAAPLAETTDRLNRGLAAQLADRVKGLLAPGQTVAILGLAYKPASHVIEESQALALALALGSSGARVVAFDPLAAEGARSVLRDKAVVLDSLPDCLAQADVVVVATPDPAFKALTADDLLRGRTRKITVFDCWRHLSPELSSNPRIHYVALGRADKDSIGSRLFPDLWKQNLSQDG